jgi:hypothetical protein
MLTGISVLNFKQTALYISDLGLPFAFGRSQECLTLKQFQVDRIKAPIPEPCMPLAQEIEARVGSDGFDEEQQIRRRDKYGGPCIMRLS